MPFQWPWTPKVAMQAQPISVNPAARPQLQRHLGRIRNILLAVEEGDARPELLDEVKRRQGALMLAGLDYIDTSDKAAEALSQLEV